MTRDRVANAIRELNRAWDELSNDNYSMAQELEEKVLEPLYTFATSKLGITEPEKL